MDTTEDIQERTEPQSERQMESLQVTEEQARDWIKTFKEEIPINQQLKRTYEENSEKEEELEKDKQFENDKYYLEFFSQRTSQQIRNRYIDRLLFNGGELEPPRKKNQHVFIFDWDDTILCTTYLSAFQFLEISPDAKAMLLKLDDCAFGLITKAESQGMVYIITNAAKGWVEYSSKKYLPRTHELLKGTKTKIMSARAMFGEEYPGDYARWKIEAFKSILKSIDKYLLTNLICIGDSNVEMEAVHCLSKELEHSLVKTIKFRENPKPQQLLKQQELVLERMTQIYDSTKNLTIRLQRKQSREKNPHST